MFTGYTLLDDYGFVAGLRKRLARKILPPVYPENSVDHALSVPGSSADAVLARIQAELQETDQRAQISAQLNRAIQALSAKVVAFGLDSDIQTKCERLEIDTSAINELAGSAYNLVAGPSTDAANFEQILRRVSAAVRNLRKRKHRIGTNLHLTMVTVRILDYVKQLERLIELKKDLDSALLWKEALDSRIVELGKRNSLRRYVQRHTDLIALEIVEHTSTKGEKYVAETRSEYHSFFYRSLLGGVLIALFALCKLLIDAQQLSPLVSAIGFSLNYAACFVLVKKVGGIIATKQPAMTASTIAKYTDRKSEFVLGPTSDVVQLIRRVLRSQFVSLVGNFTMALAFAFGLCLLLGTVSPVFVAELIDPPYLLKTIKPSADLVIYASIAGVFLALSGLISGFFDNKARASDLARRVSRSPLFFRSQAIGNYLEHSGGALLGNLCLGFFLGCAFLLSAVLPFNFDIRHIAFSAANLGFSVAQQELPLAFVLWSALGVALIGAVNFLVSFSITMAVALKSRGATYRIIPRLTLSVIRDFLSRPMSYLYFLSKEETMVSEVDAEADAVESN